MSESRIASTFKELSSLKKLDGNSPSNLAAGRALRVGVLSNPQSGGNRKGLGPVRSVLATYPQVCHREVQTPGDVASALVDFARKEVNVLAVNGGDGTIQAALTVLFARQPFETLPLLAILRAGTDSVTSRDVGLQGSRERGLRTLLRWAFAGDGDAVILKRSVLRVQMAVNQEPLYGMIFGAALIYDGVKFCHRKVYSLGLRGQLAPGVTLARYLLGLALRKRKYLIPVPITIGLDRRPPLRQDFLLVLISTLERLFLGLRPYWGGENGPLHYTAVGAQPRHPLLALPSLLRGRKGRYGKPENGYFSHNVHEARLTLNSGFILDGELYMPDVRLGPVVVRDGGQVSFLRL